MTAQGTEKVPWAENKTKGKAHAAEPKARQGFARQIVEQFRAVAKAIITMPAPQPAGRRRRREDQTQGGLMTAARRFMRHILRGQFRRLAEAVRHPVMPAHFFFHPGDFNMEERRAEAERVLRVQLDEWAREDGSHERESGFHYARRAAFDPKP